MKLAHLTAAVSGATLLVASLVAHSIPPVESGGRIEGAVISKPLGESLFNYKLNTFIQTWVNGSNTSLITPSISPTGSSTNTFSIVWDSSIVIGHYDFSDSINLTTYPPDFKTYYSPNGTDYIEVTSLRRVTPTAPLSVVIAYAREGYSGNGTPLQATPQIVDEIGNVLFSGTPVIATTAGPSGYAVTPSGAPMYQYSYVFDGIPTEIVAANVRRHLRFVLDRVINSVPQGTPVTMGSLPLTFVSDATCFELLQIGAGDATPIPAVDAHFGCPGLLPPGTCSDKTSAALAAGRDYQQATRKVSLDCGKKQNADCPASLVNQTAAYNALVGAQSMVPLYCQ